MLAMLGGFPDVPGQFSLTPLNLGQNDIVYDTVFTYLTIY